MKNITVTICVHTVVDLNQVVYIQWTIGSAAAVKSIYFNLLILLAIIYPMLHSSLSHEKKHDYSCYNVFYLFTKTRV